MLELWNSCKRCFRRATAPDPCLLVPTVWIQYPESPPASPAIMLARRDEYEASLYQRRLIRLQREVDTPLRCLYRLYESIVLDSNVGLRNEIEYFFRRHTWPVHLIPDPADDDPARYGIFACIPHLLVKAFNENIKLGLSRDATAIMTDEQLAEVRTRPKIYEEVPDWAVRVPALKETLVLPHYEHQMEGRPKVLHDFEDERASSVFKMKNILVWEPHIMFI